MINRCCFCSDEYECNEQDEEYYCPDCLSYLINMSEENEEFYI